MRKFLFFFLILLCSYNLQAQQRLNQSRHKGISAYTNAYQRITGNILNSSHEIRNGQHWAYGASYYLGNGQPQNAPYAIQADPNANWVNFSSSTSPSTSHLLALHSDGTLWAWGDNHSGQLGTGDTIHHFGAIQVGTDHDWAMVATMDYASFAIKADGSLWSWGYNAVGQLGQGDIIDRWLPTQLGSDHDWVAVRASYQDAVAMKADGSLWTWGVNNGGIAGTGDNAQHISPVQTGLGKRWVSVSIGTQHTIALAADGSLWAWGYGLSGQLGQGDQAIHLNPVQVGTEYNWRSICTGGGHTHAIQGNGSLWAWGGGFQGQLGWGNFPFQTLSPVLVNNNRNWLRITAGARYTLALKSNGGTWATGEDVDGQLGNGGGPNVAVFTLNGEPLEEWVSVACGSDHTLALRADGSLWSWGDNINGELGLGNNLDAHTPTQITYTTQFSGITAGAHMSIGMKADGFLWAWGLNDHGQLGTGNTVNQSLPVQITSDSNFISATAGNAHALGLKADGTLWAWGKNDFGQLGTGDNTEQYSPVQISGTEWLTVSAGNDFTVALRADGTIWSWGHNNNGQLGTGDNTDRNAPTQIGTAHNWTDIRAGENHAIAMKADGTIWCWGLNSSGQLGNGNNTNQNTPVQAGAANKWIAISAGANHNIALTVDGKVYAWGQNTYGQLGNTNNANQNSPVLSTASSGIVQLFNGSLSNHSALIEDNRSLVCLAGLNAHGQLGDGTIANKNTFYCLNCDSPDVTITVSPNDTICTGTLPVFTATVNNPGNTPVYQWYKNNVPVGTNSNTYSPATIANNDVIKCSFNTITSCQLSLTDTSNKITMHVFTTAVPVVTIEVSPDDTVCLDGTAVTFTATPTFGGGNPSYVWLLNGVIVGTNSPTYNMNATNGDVVQCVMTSDLSCAIPPSDSSNKITMHVLAVTPPTVTVSANPAGPITQGQSVTFTAIATNAGPNPQYQWLLNGANIPGQTAATYTSTNLNMGYIVQCKVKGQKICDTARSAEIVMTVWPVGVRQVNSGSEQVTVYPNPVRGDLTIDLSPALSKGEGVSVQVCDMAGRVLLQQTLTGKTTTVHMQSLVPGVYMYRISNNGMVVAKGMVVKE